MNVDIIEVLKQVGQSDTLKIQEGEKILNELKEKDFKNLLFNLSLVLSNDGIDYKIRQLTCIVFKNFVTKNQEDILKWYYIESNMKNQIKNNILSCLASDNSHVRKSASSLIACIIN